MDLSSVARSRPFSPLQSTHSSSPPLRLSPPRFTRTCSSSMHFGRARYVAIGRRLTTTRSSFAILCSCLAGPVTWVCVRWSCCST
ncbi:hypothetical protein BD311DRAFT_830227 [Dichomitus squalens]|uniref:Uncharacterized protein n=1 Tax=Dichomitus squalens TaxID=114155 RepID=A0A4Q9MR66_9APHY|nr:hypothetical protein BD311DRAFT_830227 [Dichomitus squalens]